MPRVTACQCVGRELSPTHGWGAPGNVSVRGPVASAARQPPPGVSRSLACQECVQYSGARGARGGQSRPLQLQASSAHLAGCYLQSRGSNMAARHASDPRPLSIEGQPPRPTSKPPQHHWSAAPRWSTSQPPRPLRGRTGTAPCHTQAARPYAAHRHSPAPHGCTGTAPKKPRHDTGSTFSSGSWAARAGGGGRGRREGGQTQQFTLLPAGPREYTATAPPPLIPPSLPPSYPPSLTLPPRWSGGEPRSCWGCSPLSCSRGCAPATSPRPGY